MCIKCIKCCDCGVEQEDRDTDEETAAAWNHRPGEDRLRSALQAAERERSEAQGRAAFLDRACALVAAERDNAIGRAEAAERERDEARAELSCQVDIREDLRSAWHSLNEALSKVAADRDAARHEAGRLAQELEHDRAWIAHVRKQCGITGDGSIIELVQGLRAAIESIRIASDGFGRCEVSSVALKQQLGWINARARKALEPKEVAGG